MEWKIPLFKIYWTEDDVKSVQEVIKRGTFWADGPEVKEFEKKLVEFTGRKYALVFNSGTSALHAMYDAFGVKDKEIIIPTFTFPATANAVVLAGGQPVFAESEDETYGLDAEDVESRITSKTRAIVALNYSGGVSRDIEKLRKIADENNILLFEDNAHSLGVRRNGKLCGTFGDAAALSFCQNKLITCGEGGAVITDSKDAYEKMRLMRSHGRVESTDKDYFSSVGDNDYIKIGYNYRMPTMCAALGISQLKNFKKTMDLRVKSGRYLSESLSKIKNIRIPKPFENSDHFYQMYTIAVKDKRDDLQTYLNNKSIMARPYYMPVHLKEFYKKNYGYKEGDLPKTEKISDRILTIPMYPDMKKDEMDFIIKTIKDFFEND
ncbi:MAG: DegT/DnrJ/EryC1/StrS family aminotransferase [Nanoarchaeota archaeon]|nr:DegT/DnrJ/EryC1/StrS family aminotransferase [Nanoarchaeota archaeon]